jgi:hypothetical protein
MRRGLEGLKRGHICFLAITAGIGICEESRSVLSLSLIVVGRDLSRIHWRQFCVWAAADGGQLNKARRAFRAVSRLTPYRSCMDSSFMSRTNSAPCSLISRNIFAHVCSLLVGARPRFLVAPRPFNASEEPDRTSFHLRQKSRSQAHDGSSRRTPA